MNPKDVIDRNGQKVWRGPLEGYKATNSDMTCRDYQFELGKVYEHSGELIECKSGFHYCPMMPGVWKYYNVPCKVWKVRAWDVLVQPDKNGTDIKLVAGRIKFVEEVVVGGDCNSGHYNSGNYNSGNYNNGNCNSGDYNSGNYNSGYRNSGNGNSGNYNSGHYNSGNRNSGDYNNGNGNSGDRNSGNYNSGYRNSGDRNSGNYNSGHYNNGNGNSGDRNSGDYNSGDYNVTDRSSGMFNISERFMVFGVLSKVAWEDIDHDLAYDFYEACKSGDPVEYERYLGLPNATIARLKRYHKKLQETNV